MSPSESSALAASFPLAPIDGKGQQLLVGSVVHVCSVESCARGLPSADQNRLYSLVGSQRAIVEFDGNGFVWLSFSEGAASVDFCLFPAEVLLA